MTSDALAVVQCLFQTIWRLFTSWHIPGTATTPAGFFIFALFLVLGLRLIKGIFPGLASKSLVSGKSDSSGGDSE